MADLNSLIAQGAQFNVPDQLGQFAKLQQIQQGMQQQQLGAQQLQASQTQNQVSQMQLEDLQRDRADMLKFQDELAKSGKPTDLHVYADLMMKSPKHFQMGVELKQKLLQQDQFSQIMGGGAPTAAPVAPAAAPFPTVQPPSGALGSGTFNPNAPINALAPAATTPAAPTNALAQPTPVANVDTDALRRKRDAFLAMGTPQAIAAANSINEDIKAASVQHVAGPGSSVYDSRGNLVASTPERTDTDLIRNFKAAKEQGFKGDIFEYEKRLNEAKRAPAPAMPKAPAGYRWDATGTNLEKIPGGPADKEEKLKPIPPQINTAIITNQQSIQKLKDTLSMLDKNPDAVGIKGLLPQGILNRMDEQGMPVRAAIADVGSIVLHQRSGAAVTASEEPRLLPFIPTPSDTYAAAKTKVKRMLDYALSEQEALKGTYSEDQGYRSNPILTTSNAKSPSGGSVLDAADAILAKGRK